MIKTPIQGPTNPHPCGLRRLLQRLPNTSVPGQGFTGPSADPTVRPACCSADTRRTSSSILSDVVLGRDRGSCQVHLSAVRSVPALELRPRRQSDLCRITRQVIARLPLCCSGGGTTEDRSKPRLLGRSFAQSKLAVVRVKCGYAKAICLLLPDNRPERPGPLGVGRRATRRYPPIRGRALPSLSEGPHRKPGDRAIVVGGRRRVGVFHQNLQIHFWHK
jgi:hypothetical protein